MEKVMNNNDLRGVILSYFHEVGYKECDICKTPCKKNEETQLKEHVSWSGFVRWNECFIDNFFYLFKK